MTPTNKGYTLHYPVSQLRRGGNVLRLKLEHFREERGELVCAEGESLAYASPSSTTDIFCANNRVFCFAESSRQGKFMDTGDSYPAGSGMHNLVALTDSDARERYFAIGETTFYYYSETPGSIVTFSPTPSTTALALHHERLFGAVGSRVYYTKPLDFRGWNSYGEHDAGYFDLLPGAGSVVDIVAMRDKVFFLRRYGITRLTGYCDIYNFRQEEMPFDMGEIYSRAAVIGEKAYFFTDQGLCCFDGTDSKHVEGASDEEVVLVTGIRVGVAEHKYVAAEVLTRDGVNAIYLYDPVLKRGRFVCRNFDACAFGPFIYTLRNGNVYRLLGKALPTSGKCKVLTEICFSHLGEGEKWLEGVHIPGRGTFVVDAVGENGSCSVSAVAGEWTRFPSALRGEKITLTVGCAQTNVILQSIDLRVRKEDRV